MSARSDKTVRIGTRGSSLALAQAGLVRKALALAHPGVTWEIVTVTTRGDRDPAAPVAALGVGVFVKELETALKEDRIDLAVHSAKDMPSKLPRDMVIGAFLERADARDALISRHGNGLDGLPHGARVGTGSARRKAQLLATRPDFRVEPVRGNVDTRLARLRDPQYGFDALILAAAGLARLGRANQAAELLDHEVFVPAVGQGAIAIEVRRGDNPVLALAGAVDHRPTRQAVEAERAFLDAIGGGCSSPVTAYATVSRGKIKVATFIAAPDGSGAVWDNTVGPARDPDSVGRSAAKSLLTAGGSKIIGTLAVQPPGDHDG